VGIEQALVQEQVLHLDLQNFTVVESGTTVQEVIDQMRHERHNCALVQKKGALIGIFTERDVLARVVTDPGTWKKKIDEMMTPRPSTIAPSDSAKSALKKMEEGHFRNVPVVDEDGKVHGNVTHYAFIKFLAEHFPQEIYNQSPDEGIHEDRYGG
jgi:CBS domain-containing protein